MALVDRGSGLVLTAAPGTGSTALREAFLTRPGVVEVPAKGAELRTAREAGVDAKHGTVRELVGCGLLTADHGLRVVTTTRNPFDFYVAEYERTRTRWVLELRDPDSWVHTTPGALDGIVAALTLDFPVWLARAVGDPDGSRRINRGHVEEADVVLRMEHLEDDVRRLLGLDLPVPATNVTERERAYWRLYTVEGRRLVERTHAADLERFGYRF
ncbi:hypothetical protein ASG49_00605 [Marmoricola sp. Leaf446]|uniref:hypothetical protein n=1 Tax=Marmoricola sp. Leaf446 TaxID=1736379 RepID=UPI000700C340|nr:hypothetical protein [Marmoricola sp. Leaf446]KQT93547.1 hypothetical protein ASG49_00605 [Marmoricola sp. Leaf446]